MEGKCERLDYHGSILVPHAVQEASVRVHKASQVEPRDHPIDVDLTIVGGLRVKAHEVKEGLGAQKGRQKWYKDQGHDKPRAIVEHPTHPVVPETLGLGDQGTQS